MRTLIINIFYVLLIYSYLKINISNTLHLKGQFKTNDFFKFITRFGIQSTDVHNILDTRGYIYGNISLIDSTDPNFDRSQPEKYKFPSNSMIMLTVMDYNYFIDYYNNRLMQPKSYACPLMFENIKKIAYFFECNENNTEDFIRRVPCEQNKLCIDEDNDKNVIKNFQFTYKIQDFNQARFWYISLVACTRDTKTCEWRDLSYQYHYDNNQINNMSMINNSTNLTTTSTTTSTIGTTMSRQIKYKEFPSFTLEYDIWLVQGNPLSSSRNNQFEHQFSYELHDIFEIYLCSLIVYSFIIPFIFARVYSNFHYLYFQLLVYVCVEAFSRISALLHNFIFSFNGRGLYFFQSFSDFLESFASSILILIVLSIAKGWTIRSSRLIMTKKFILFGLLMQSLLVTSHMISLSTIDPVFNTNSYETIAGYVELSVRFVCMIWFLFELNETFDNLEQAAFKNTQRSNIVNNNQTNENCNQNDEHDIYDLLDEEDYEIERDGKKYFSLIEQQKRRREILKNNFLSQDNGTTNNNNNFDNSLTMDERLLKYRKFYLHYGACCLVWFIYLPILILITSFLSELYRLRLVLSIRYFVNFICVLVLFYIMWSTKTPLKLPGKKAKSSLFFKYDESADNLINMQYLNVYHNEGEILNSNDIITNEENSNINNRNDNNNQSNSQNENNIESSIEEDTVYISSSNSVLFDKKENN